MSRHAPRQKLARRFGGNRLVTERCDMTNGSRRRLGVGNAMATQESMMQAIGSARPRGSVSYVGVPHGVALDGERLFYSLSRNGRTPRHQGATAAVKRSGHMVKSEFRKIEEANDLHTAPFCEDRVTYGTPTWIWSVAVGDALHVRGYNGTMYQTALRQKAGRITTRPNERCDLRAVEGPINHSIDDAYRSKYGGSPNSKPMIGPRARPRR